MKLTEIDRNLAFETKLNLSDAHWCDVRVAPFEVCGLIIEDGKFRRMPQAVANTVSAAVADMNARTSGGRIRFRTDSPYIAIYMERPNHDVLPHFTPEGKCGCDLYICDGGEYKYKGAYLPAVDSNCYESRIGTDGQMHTYVIHLPLFSNVNQFLVGVKDGSTVEAPEPYAYEKPILYYGSSITMGACASRPSNTYEAMVSRMLHCDHINLGWSGNAKGEKEIAEYMATLDPLVFVCDYDYNADDAEHLRKTHYRIYDEFRKKHKKTPVIMVSGIHPVPNYEERRQVIKDSYEKALATGDKHVYFLDGMTILEGELRDSCTIECTHPNDLGFYRMAVSFASVIRKAIEEME